MIGRHRDKREIKTRDRFWPSLFLERWLKGFPIVALSRSYLQEVLYLYSHHLQSRFEIEILLLDRASPPDAESPPPKMALRV